MKEVRLDVVSRDLAEAIDCPRLSAGGVDRPALRSGILKRMVDAAGVRHDEGSERTHAWREMMGSSGFSK